MSTLIPQLSISEFRKLKATELKELQSSEIYSDGEYLFTFINPQTEFVRIQTEYLAQTSNSVGGRKLEDILSEGVKV